MPTVIVEGPDGSGKTRLLETIRQDYPNFALFHHTNNKPTEKDLNHIYFHFMADIVSPILTLYDRFPLISELMYGPILRDKCLVSAYSQAALLESLQKEPAMIIYCRPEIEEIHENVNSGKHRSGVPQNITRLVERYDHYMGELYRQGANVIEYNYQDPSHKPLEKIFEFEKENSND